MSAKEFQADIQKLADKLDVSVGIVTTKLALEAWTRITERTPVDTGRARASWSIKEGEPASGTPEEGEDHLEPDPPGLKPFSGKHSVFITSALDYIRYLEEGSSQQAPAGMIAITLAELEAEAEAIINSDL